MKTWVEFVKRFENLKASNMMGENTRIQGGNSSHFMKNIQLSIEDSKLFRIGEHTKKLLMLTTPPNKNDAIHLPFENVFVGAYFTKEECKLYGWKVEHDICGFIIQEGDLKSIFGTNAGKTIRIIACLDLGGGNIEFNTYNLELNLDEEFKNSEVKYIKPTNPLSKKFLHTFSINLLNLINDPEIELVVKKEDKKQNIKRQKRGKCFIPQTTLVRLDEKRSVYIDSLVSGGHFVVGGSGYAWFVRGHWRELKSKIYKKNIGKKMWILPYIKNEKGILITKDYKVGHD